MWPGWLADPATVDRSNPYFDIGATVNYTLNWLRGARARHALDIDYIGVRFVLSPDYFNIFQLLDASTGIVSHLFKMLRVRTLIRV